MVIMRDLDYHSHMDRVDESCYGRIQNKEAEVDREIEIAGHEAQKTLESLMDAKFVDTFIEILKCSYDNNSNETIEWGQRLGLTKLETVAIASDWTDFAVKYWEQHAYDGYDQYA